MLIFNLKIYGNNKFQDETFGIITGNQSSDYIYLADLRFYNCSNADSGGGHQILTFGMSYNDFNITGMSLDVLSEMEDYPRYDCICPVVTIGAKIKIIGGTGTDSNNAYELKK